MSDQREISQSLAEVSGTLSTRGYSLLRKLGEGTYAKVYMAVYVPPNDSRRKVHLACKVVDTAKAPRDFVRRFLPRELDILVRLNHPHIVHVHSIFQRRTKYFIFMRLAEKGDLLDWVLRHGAVTEGQSRVWMRQLSLALQYLQALEIAHRDLKCENVLITANYNVKLADFGFARYCIDARGRRILSGTNCGSLSYAAPEILRGEQYDPKISDVWSLGVVLYIMLNKAMPFDDSNINRLHDEQIHRRWRFCASVVDTLSEQVKNLIYNLLEPDTQRRYQVDQILASDWIAMDARLAKCTPAEESALAAARNDREQRMRRDMAEATGPALVPAPAAPAPVGPSELGGVREELESVRFGEDSPEMQDLRGVRAEHHALPRTPEELDIIGERGAAENNPHAQPSHGAISIVDSVPLPVTNPPEFLPPDLSEKLTSKAPSQTSKKMTEDESADSPQDQEKNTDSPCKSSLQTLHPHQPET
ncbi:Testis-specific serine/threonine-protein kinase 1 [Frankliniella fusca]|uniref:Testis-specific serine/threonine-protein kinase 1 n=1 Tax=Frankliniella fusca TaxID=407009 RepID=A0AAE1LAG1_9NEOP|nr:Testis-specific serine/threonine-protein kinase 1 [Frankliniella fusca]